LGEPGPILKSRSLSASPAPDLDASLEGALLIRGSQVVDLDLVVNVELVHLPIIGERIMGGN
jgi:hypothetical protein